MHDKPGLIGCSNGPVSGFSTLSIVGFTTLYYVNEDGKRAGFWFDSIFRYACGVFKSSFSRLSPTRRSLVKDVLYEKML